MSHFHDCFGTWSTDGFSAVKYNDNEWKHFAQNRVEIFCILISHPLQISYFIHHSMQYFWNDTIQNFEAMK